MGFEYFEALTADEQQEFAAVYEALRQEEKGYDGEFPFLKKLSRRSGFDSEQAFRLALDYANIKRERSEQSERGRRGGTVASGAKAAAARENGRKGGRPKNTNCS